MSCKKMTLIVSFALLIGCSSTEKKLDTTQKESRKNSGIIEKVAVKNKEYLKLDLGKEVVPQPIISTGEVIQKKEVNGTKFIEVYDPLEPLNRRIYYFNYYLDKYVLIPAVNVYEFIAPNMVQKGVSNFFSNLQDISTFINSLLQLEGRKATITLARFGINTIVGVLGLFDVATRMELPKTYEDFGLTFAKYGVGNGPYLVLPGFGPSNLRDTTGKSIGAATIYNIDPYDSVGVDVNNWGVAAVDAVNIRKETKKFRYYGTGSPFEYEYVRYFYTKYRDTLIGINDVNGRGE
ncbi:VacJ family lipoprotein [uncultured Cetobacterium sp.]|uniref:MlaA family lipoprotein n=1 Tax=uncultured Cetobacterium sp. TaxID=527638 RepID=UPI00261A4264|nr:VacJ family lipoprotein [uncultured Cetobacterium sp.]